MTGQYKFKVSKPALWALWLSRLSIPVAILSFVLMRFGGLHPSVAIYCFATAVLLALLAVLVSLIALPGIWFEGNIGGKRLWGAFLRSQLILLPTLAAAYFYFTRPDFSDLSTNPLDPPAFSEAWSEREDADNRLDIADLETREQKALAYPELASKLINHPLELVSLMVEDTIKDNKWVILHQSGGSQYDTERLFEVKTSSLITGLRYVMAVRLEDDGDDGTIVDMRSASLWGTHDMGLNARRITSFMQSLDEKLDTSIKRYELRLEQIERQRRLDMGPIPRSKPKRK